VTLTDWCSIFPKLRSTKVRGKMFCERLYVEADEVKQLRLNLA